MARSRSQRTNARVALAATGLGIAGASLGAVTLLGGFHSDPTVGQIAALARQPTTISAADARGQTVDGVRFPDWSAQGWVVLTGWPVRDDGWQTLMAMGMHRAT